MLNKLIDGICIALDTEFGDSYDIHTENIKQGLKEPCFFINCLNPANKHYINETYKRTNQFCIQYFPSTKEVNFECNEISERLFNCLEYIYIGNDLTRGTDMHCEIIDGVLNFFVDYDFFTKKVPKEHEKMDTIEIKIEKG